MEDGFGRRFARAEDPQCLGRFVAIGRIDLIDLMELDQRHVAGAGIDVQDKDRNVIGALVGLDSGPAADRIGVHLDRLDGQFLAIVHNGPVRQRLGQRFSGIAHIKLEGVGVGAGGIVLENGLARFLVADIVAGFAVPGAGAAIGAEAHLDSALRGAQNGLAAEIGQFQDLRDLSGVARRIDIVRRLHARCFVMNDLIVDRGVADRQIGAIIAFVIPFDPLEGHAAHLGHVVDIGED